MNNPNVQGMCDEDRHWLVTRAVRAWHEDDTALWDYLIACIRTDEEASEMLDIAMGWDAEQEPEEASIYA